MHPFRLIRQRALTSALLVLACGGAMLATPAGAASDGKAVKVATSTPFPPFTYKEDGKFVGFENELFHAVARAGGFQIEVLESAQFEGIIPGLMSGRYEAAYNGFSDNPTRYAKFNLVGWAKGQSELLTLQKNLSTLKTPKDICGRRVAVVLGSEVHAAAVRFLAKQNCGDEAAIEQVPMSGDTSTAVKSGRADAMYSSTFASTVTLSKLPDFARYGTPFGRPSVIGMLIPKSNEALTAKAVAGLKAIIADGTYAKIMAKWDLQSSMYTDVTVNKDQ